MALAKPVMGTSVPAPARFASSSNHPRPVASAVAKISVTDTAVPACSLSSPQDWYRFISPCPTAQIPPPTKKAQSIFFPMGEGLARSPTSLLYSSLDISTKTTSLFPSMSRFRHGMKIFCIFMFLCYT